MARQPVTFFASPKKVTQKRRPHSRCPCGVPVCARQKMGSVQNSLRSDMDTSFSIFCPAQTAAPKRGRSKTKPKPKTNPQYAMSIACGYDVSMPGLAVAVVFDLPPLETMQFALRRKWIRKTRCLRRSRVSGLSHFLRRANCADTQ